MEMHVGGVPHICGINPNLNTPHLPSFPPTPLLSFISCKLLFSLSYRANSRVRARVRKRVCERKPALPHGFKRIYSLATKSTSTRYACGQCGCSSNQCKSRFQLCHVSMTLSSHSSITLVCHHFEFTAGPIRIFCRCMWTMRLFLWSMPITIYISTLSRVHDFVFALQYYAGVPPL